MAKKIKFADEDIKLNNLTVSKDFSEGRIKEYNQVFYEIYDQFGYTPSSLLEKAKEDQKQYIKDGVIEQKSLDGDAPGETIWAGMYVPYDSANGCYHT